jgi:hypothetical protein
MPSTTFSSTVKPCSRLKVWKHVADFPGAQAVAARLAESGHLGAVEHDAPGVRGEDAGDEVEKRGLARAALAAQRDLLAGGEGKFRHAHNFDARSFRGHKRFGEIGDGEHRRGESWAQKFRRHTKISQFFCTSRAFLRPTVRLHPYQRA